ncbi:cobalamin B12-binding domain-containing protein [Amycolatopsis decaplanina]|uniref:Cobalamin B12-binding domain-containing protein n=1 Tax=Amycolatopsis decaplanina DSM 44594 TaxID=1284240 RepID=M2YB04_9PSEU|nr:cobalamin-dependent protein [Amycolatopsis decaplanina]EME58795.1 cobalamin B12-binding domain-containing protein [Amycolatopsis decaplanina DSM 44594]
MTAEYFERLWQAVTAGDEYAAGEVVVQALGAGLDAESVLLDVVAAVQRKVGHEWAANRLTVAQEHAATAINDRVLAGFGYVLPRPRKHRGRIAVACVDGEWHAMPARLLAEVLKVRGFHVDYLGAQVPAPHLVAHLHRTGPDAVALSASLATRLPAAHATITACQAAATPVIAGGAAFGPDGRYARLLGADAWAPDAREAADLLTSPLPRPRTGHQPLDDLPHLADQEYTLVSRTSDALVKAVLAGLDDRVPAMRGYTSRQRQHTAEDVAHIVEYLTVSLYVGDEELFTGFLAWTAEILSARQVPAGSLLPALELLRGELHDFPRSRAMIDAAHARLGGTLTA